MTAPLFVSLQDAQINSIAARMSRNAPQGPGGSARKVKGEHVMEKVIIPTVFGFAAMMGLWAIVGAVA
ncbi:hypothetical protein [Tateyamaria sp. SN6-1]|uniref:hypothetical protein n=1 Tax=Tateyamaria sp. SN6-1 TaxID=3092148 RepID=UPI0039F51A61